MSERHLVAVSWAMPPALFPRSLQVARLLRGLHGHGWRSTVVTLADRSRSPFDQIDPSLAEIYSPFYTVEQVPYKEMFSDPWDLRFRWKLGPLSPVDSHWVLDAASEARRAFWRDAEVLVTFAQPWRDHFVGLVFGRPRLPWIAHFSDPWVDSLYYADLPDADRELDRARERAILAACDLAVFTNDHAAELVMRKYPDAIRRKARVVPHAWDPDVLSLLRTAPTTTGDRRPLRICYAGTLLAGRRTAADLLAALADLHRRLGLTNRLEFVVVGSGSGTADAQQKVERLGLQEIVRFQPRVSYLESVEAMQASDVLLLLDAPADANVFLPSKLADYLMTGRCVVAITPARGASADVVDRCGFPRLDPDDVSGIAAVIQGLLERHENGQALPSVRADVAAPFRLDSVASAFAALLDESVARFSWRKRWLSRT